LGFVRSLGVAVSMSNGNVSILLTGRVRSWFNKQRAQELAFEVAGSMGVAFELENKIEVI